MLVPVPLSLSFFKGFEGTATAATLPVTTSAVVAGSAMTTAGATGGGMLAGGMATKAAAVVAAAAITGGVAVVGSTEIDSKSGGKPPAQTTDKPGSRLGQVAPRGVLVPGNGVARGKAAAPGQLKRLEAKARARAAAARKRGSSGRNVEARAKAPGQAKHATERASTTRAKKDTPSKQQSNEGPTDNKVEKSPQGASANATTSSDSSSASPPESKKSSPSKSAAANGQASGSKAP
jgi:hypothetical protein